MKKFSILLVDDEERILNFLKTKLKSLGLKYYLPAMALKPLSRLGTRNRIWFV